MPAYKMSDARKSALGFAPTQLEGLKISQEEDGWKAAAPIGHMTACYGGVVGACVVSEGMMTFGFNVKTPCVDNVSATQIVVGVADATMAKDTTFGRVLGYHIGRSKIVTSKSLHKIKSGGKSLSRDTPRRLPINADGHISIMAVVDMHTRRMSIAINRNTPIDTGYYLPAAVRPWVWLGGPGVGAVTLTEYTMIAAIPQSSTIGSQARMAVTDKTNAGRRPSGGDPTGPTALAPAQLAIDTSDVKTTTAEHVAAKGMIAPISPLQQAMYPTPSTPEVRALAMTLDSVKPLNLNTKPPDSDTNSGGSNETSRSMFDPSEWTARATEWFKPMQQMFLNDDADTAPTLMELEKRQVVQVL